MESSRRVWTNSTFGRLVGTVLGIVLLVMPFTAGGPPPFRASQIPITFFIWASGFAVTYAVWTSRLVLEGGILTATNFGIVRSMLLIEVHDIDWSALPGYGGKIRRKDKTGIRTLVSGRTWDELWKPRAAKIEEELLRLANQARGTHDADGTST